MAAASGFVASFCANASRSSKSGRRCWHSLSRSSACCAQPRILRLRRSVSFSCCCLQFAIGARYRASLKRSKPKLRRSKLKLETSKPATVASRATWAAALLLAGSFLLFAVNLQSSFLCLAALAAVFVYTRTAKLSLGMHASFYLAAATAVSPLPTYVVGALAGRVPGRTCVGAFWIVAVSAVFCYAVGSRVTEPISPSAACFGLIPAVLDGFHRSCPGRGGDRVARRRTCRTWMPRACP